MQATTTADAVSNSYGKRSRRVARSPLHHVQGCRLPSTAIAPGDPYHLAPPSFQITSHQTACPVLLHFPLGLSKHLTMFSPFPFWYSHFPDQSPVCISHLLCLPSYALPCSAAPQNPAWPGIRCSFSQLCERLAESNLRQLTYGSLLLTDTN